MFIGVGLLLWGGFSWTLIFLATSGREVPNSSAAISFDLGVSSTLSSGDFSSLAEKTEGDLSSWGLKMSWVVGSKSEINGDLQDPSDQMLSWIGDQNIWLKVYFIFLIRVGYIKRVITKQLAIPLVYRGSDSRDNLLPLNCLTFSAKEVHLCWWLRDVRLAVDRTIGVEPTSSSLVVESSEESSAEK